MNLVRTKVLDDEVDQPEAAGDADQEEIEYGAAKGVGLVHLSLLSEVVGSL